MLQNYFSPKLLHTAAYQNYYFKQDGATLHTANIVQKYLSRKISARFIDKKMWPPTITRLKPCIFFKFNCNKSVFSYANTKSEFLRYF